MRSQNDEKMFFYDKFAENFDRKMNMYDLNKRIQYIFQSLGNIQGKKLLDAGCGTGWFSKEATERGAQVFSLDIGKNLLSQVAAKCKTEKTAASVLEIPFFDDCFDIVISSEVIEHTVNPKGAIHEMHRVLKKDGVLALTVPNKIWHPAILIANKLKVRPYEGYENWVGWNELQEWLSRIGFNIDRIDGFHLFPFIFPFTYRLLSVMEKYSRLLGPFMLNISVKAIKV